jgi:hypothetical protein
MIFKARPSGLAQPAELGKLVKLRVELRGFEPLTPARCEGDSPCSLMSLTIAQGRWRDSEQPVAWPQGTVTSVPLGIQLALTYHLLTRRRRPSADSPEHGGAAGRPSPESGPSPRRIGLRPLWGRTARAVRWSAKGASHALQGPPSSCKARGSAEAGARSRNNPGNGDRRTRSR